MYNKIVMSVCLIAVCAGGGWYWSTHRPAPRPATPEVSESSVLPYFAPGQTPAEDQNNTQDMSTETPNASTTTANQNIMNATLHTNKGDITIQFLPEQAPNTVANFEKLASSGFYDKTKFHRVIKGFMIQGGDPLSKDDSQEAKWGTGGPGYTFKDELGPDNHNLAGTIAMANSGPDTNGSQFFINAVDNSYLDDKHTVFGKVIQGMDVVEAIDSVQTDSSDRPIDPVVIESISLN